MTASGERLGRYEIVGLLGQGGFATVYRARDPVLERIVALKALLPHLSSDPLVRSRFLAEGRALAGLRHPNVVTVYDVGEAAGRPFFTMEFVPGATLQARLAGGIQLPLAETVRLLEPLASALDAVHAAGLVHRDVKPANVVIEPNGRVVLMDLGIALAVDDAGQTRTGVSLGTPTCMSPEQVRGERVTAASDIYALGILSYRMLNGQAPFTGNSVYVLHAQAYEPAPPLAALRPDLPDTVYAAIDAALAKDPAGRPASAMAFVGLLTGDADGPTRALPAIDGAVLARAAAALPAFAIEPTLVTSATEPYLNDLGTESATPFARASGVAGRGTPPAWGDRARRGRIGALLAGALLLAAAGAGALAIALRAPASHGRSAAVVRAVVTASPQSAAPLAAAPTAAAPAPPSADAAAASRPFAVAIGTPAATPHEAVSTPSSTPSPAPSPAPPSPTATPPARPTPAAAVASTPAPTAISPPGLTQSRSADQSGPRPRITAIRPASGAVSGGVFVFTVSAVNDGSAGGLSSISVSSPDTQQLQAAASSCDLAAQPVALPPGANVVAVHGGQLGRGTTSVWLAELDFDAWPAGAACTLTVTVQLPAARSATFFIRTTIVAANGQVATSPASSPDVDQQGFPVLRWDIPLQQ